MRHLLFLIFIALASSASAQTVTDEQYVAALQAITPEATYRIYTFHNGKREGQTRYYLTTDGWLVTDTEAAGQFTFHKIEDDDLYLSPGWQFDNYFTNPDCRGGDTDQMRHYGYIRTAPSLARTNWEGQVWYKEGDTYAVRATNSPYDSWGANSFWTVEEDMDGDDLPNAEYSLTPLFTWRLEKVADPVDPDDPHQKDVQRLTNLPHLYLETFNKRAITSKSTYVLARLWYIDENDEVTFYDSLEVRGRGNSTWGLAKKPYKLKFKEKEKFLGKGYAKAKKWTLMANHGDKTLIRNALTSLMGERTGLKFNPAAKFVDLTINDNYVGNYQISDQIDVRPHRVNIQEQDWPLTGSSDITGGYLLEADGSHDFHSSSYWDNDAQRYLVPDGFSSPHVGVPVRIHYPEADELDERQRDFIYEFVAEFEDALYADNFRDPERGYRSMVDSTSLVNWYLCTEMSGNVDGFYSTFFYKEQAEDLFYWGPLWDYDIAYNNDNRTRGGSNNTTFQLMKDIGYGDLRRWIQRMWEDPWFLSLVNRRYQELLDDGMEDFLLEKIDSLTTLIDASQQLNYHRWGIDTRALRELVLYSTYDEYVADVKEYINTHFAFLAESFADAAPKPEPPITPGFVPTEHYFYQLTNYKTGTAFDYDPANNLVCANQPDAQSQRQQWQLKVLSNGWLHITNRMTGLALHDPSEEGATATSHVGAQMEVAKADSTNARQQWNLFAQPDGLYNLINRYSQHCLNLRNGSSADGTQILSYTSDDRNASSGNRLWRIAFADSLQLEDGLRDLPEPLEMDYALAFEPQSRHLHFGADDLSALTFAVRIFNAAGQPVRTFRASEGTYLKNLPSGLYVITWEVNGRRRSVKLNI
ncbi:MAG: CotH kinase family protein [Bacteroidaceae bacterium]|nr:CotH kinase family protein [Bacteroidaceae bacterium]